MLKRSVVVAVALLCAATAWAQKNKLNLFIWSEYIDPSIVARFEKEFDCKVTVDLYEDNESMVAKLQGGGVALYDIVVPSEYIIPSMLAGKLLAPIRRENVPNFKHLDARFAERESDPGGRYTAPYQWGTVGIYLRRGKGERIDETWGLMFDPKKQTGSFLMMDDTRAMIGAALKYRGYSLNTTDRQQLKEAMAVLMEAKQRSQGFEGGVGGKNKVLSKVVKMAVVYNGDAVRGMKEDAETYFFVPREGSEIWVDCLAIPAKAPHRDMAEAFINYVLEPRIGAKLSNFNQYATPNKASLEFIAADDLKNTAIYPTPGQMKTLEFIRDLGAKTPWYDELWTAVKSR